MSPHFVKSTFGVIQREYDNIFSPSGMTSSLLPVIQMTMGSCPCLRPIFVKPTSEAGEYEYNKTLIELISINPHFAKCEFDNILVRQTFTSPHCVKSTLVVGKSQHDSTWVRLTFVKSTLAVLVVAPVEATWDASEGC